MTRRFLATCSAAAFVVALALAPALVGRGDEQGPGTSVEVEPAAPAAAAQPAKASGWEPLPPRAEQSAEQRQAHIAELRRLYRLPPDQWPAPHVDEGVAWQEIGLLPAPPHPGDNPHSAAKAELGKWLFFDPRLSESGQIACASCHDPDLAWADGRTVAFGVNRLPLTRNAPTVMNTAYHAALFWDGRAASLEEQAEQVVLNPNEMRGTPELVAERLRELPAYRELFAQAFDGAEPSLKLAAQAIACYERTIVGGRSRFDAYLKGNDDALSDEAVVGLDLFRREGRCMNCHHGPALTDSKAHEVGLSYYGRKFQDLGRYTVTQQTEDVGRFRTASLRNISETGPYMHNGLFPTLRGVLNMYNAGMPTIRPKPHQVDDPLFPQKSPHLRALGLNRRDLTDLEAFLKALAEPKLRVRPPDYAGPPPDFSAPAADSPSAPADGKDDGDAAEPPGVGVQAAL